MDPERWFMERTFHCDRFADIGSLVEMKRAAGSRISVCLPTLNTARTIGESIRVFRTELMEKYPLIDQLCIIDSRSTDGTIEIAEAEGAEIFFDDEILPGMEPATGKGEALWKSLFVLEGDIIAWIDSDIENIHPRFVYGTVGPLLADAEIGYVKAFYERPIKDPAGLRPSGGGRVTELTVRPLFNLFYPELAGLVQPLSGEYAGRRSVFEQIPFFTGYGVESGMLIDILDRFGLGAIAQTDVEVRVHDNQQIGALSRMSFGIMQAIFRRLEDDGKVSLGSPLRNSFNVIERQDGLYTGKPVEIKVVERPPMIDLPEYRERAQTRG